MHLDHIQQHHIENYGLNSAGGSIGNRPESAQRAHEYGQHMRRMELDPEYRMRWEQNEREMEEAKARGYEHL